MNDYEKGWVSAFIDSEGSLIWAKNRMSPKMPVVQITNTNFLLLTKAQKLLGGTLCYHSGANLVAWQLQIHFKYWKSWLCQIPLIEKEVTRQEFLMFQMRKEKC